jgi:hypothetical protein
VITSRLARAAATALIVSFTIAIAVPAQGTIRVVDRSRARGDFAVTSASGSVDEPRRLWVKVRARPNQGVHVTWIVTCSRAGDSGSRDGDFNATTPVRRLVKMPYRRPDSCTFAGSARLDDSGRLTLILQARV